jgi:predicted Zn-dependent protease
MRRAAPALLLSLVLAGCQVLGHGTPTRVEPVAVVSPRVPSAAEQAIGARENPRVVAEYGGAYSDSDLQSAVDKVVERLAKASDDPSRHYTVTVLNSPVANAFALPGGYLYITRGLVALTDSASELAAVLAHEMAHVLLNHALERAKATEQAQLVQQVAADVLSDPKASQTTRDGSQRTLATFSRNQEIEADRVGITIAGRAGFDPFAAARFLDKLEAYAAFRSATGRHDDSTSFLATHPATLERKQLAVQVARQFGAPGIGEQDDGSYLKALDGMVFGDDPSEGFVRGHEFLHPRLAIAFRVPDTFRLENTKQAVLAASGEDTAMRFDGVTVAESTPPATYLASGWINGLVNGSIKETTVNGLPAATAEAAAGNWVFRIGVVQVGGSMFRLIFADRNGPALIDGALATTLASFHRMSKEEIAQLKPLVISVVKARKGDTIDSLAARMQGTERPAELFDLLNGLQPGDVPVPGQLVKLVVD